MNFWRDRHHGRDLLILANGPSLRDHNIARAPCMTMGMNETFMYWWSDYHVAIERDQWDQFPGVYRQMDDGRLFVVGEWPVGERIPLLMGPARDRTPFSFDLDMGAVEGVDGIGSVAYLALQLAVWMGFRRIYFVGLDLGPRDGQGHAMSDRPADLIMEIQNQLFLLAAEALEGTKHEVRVIGTSSRCTAFEKIDWPWG